MPSSIHICFPSPWHKSLSIGWRTSIFLRRQFQSISESLAGTRTAKLKSIVRRSWSIQKIRHGSDRAKFRCSVQMIIVLCCVRLLLSSFLQLHPLTSVMCSMRAGLHHPTPFKSPIWTKTARKTKNFRDWAKIWKCLAVWRAFCNQCTRLSHMKTQETQRNETTQQHQWGMQFFQIHGWDKEKDLVTSSQILKTNKMKILEILSQTVYCNIILGCNVWLMISSMVHAKLRSHPRLFFSLLVTWLLAQIQMKQSATGHLSRRRNHENYFREKILYLTNVTHLVRRSTCTNKKKASVGVKSDKFWNRKVFFTRKSEETETFSTHTNNSLTRKLHIIFTSHISFTSNHDSLCSNVQLLPCSQTTRRLWNLRNRHGQSPYLQHRSWSTTRGRFQGFQGRKAMEPVTRSLGCCDFCFHLQDGCSISSQAEVVDGCSCRWTIQTRPASFTYYPIQTRHPQNLPTKEEQDSRVNSSVKSHWGGKHQIELQFWKHSKLHNHVVLWRRRCNLLDLVHAKNILKDRSYNKHFIHVT